MASVAPVWDGNETWMVMGGAGLLAAFPAAFSILMPALYFPMLIMLLPTLYSCFSIATSDLSFAYDFFRIFSANRSLVFSSMASQTSAVDPERIRRVRR